MPRRFSIIIVHRNGAAMPLKAYAACKAARDQIFVVDASGNAGTPVPVATFPHVQPIRNLLP